MWCVDSSGNSRPIVLNMCGCANDVVNFLIISLSLNPDDICALSLAISLEEYIPVFVELRYSSCVLCLSLLNRGLNLSGGAACIILACIIRSLRVVGSTNRTLFLYFTGM